MPKEAETSKVRPAFLGSGSEDLDGNRRGFPVQVFSCSRELCHLLSPKYLTQESLTSGLGPPKLNQGTAGSDRIGG